MRIDMGVRARALTDMRAAVTPEPKMAQETLNALSRFAL